MKYIRTKEGLFEVEDEILAPNGEDEPSELWFKVVGKAELINSIRVINQADKIEELCDEAVFFDNDNVPHYKSKEGELWYLGASLFSTSLRFGIWTSKGLKYVAKMDSEGKLVLI